MRKIVAGLFVILFVQVSVAQESKQYKRSESTSDLHKYGSFHQTIIEETKDGEIPENYPVYKRGMTQDQYKQERVSFMAANPDLFKEETLKKYRINQGNSSGISEEEYKRKKYNLDKIKVQDPSLVEKRKAEKLKKGAK